MNGHFPMVNHVKSHMLPASPGLAASGRGYNCGAAGAAAQPDQPELLRGGADYHRNRSDELMEYPQLEMSRYYILHTHTHAYRHI